MQVLISPTSLEEAASILETEVDIIDVKNVNEGSLGAQFPWHTRKVVEITKPRGIKTSATLGDLPYKPGTAALAAYGSAMCGVGYIKAGLYGVNTYEQAREMMDAVRQAVRMVGEDIDVVAVEPREGFRLWVRFEDGTEGEVDLSDLAGQGVFERWSTSPEEFSQAEVDRESGTVVWPGGLDVAPDRLYAEVVRGAGEARPKTKV